MGDDVMVLLRQDGARWNVVEYVIGPSDVAWDGWRQERRPPRQVSTDQRRAAHGGALSADMS